jgi:hypothetical protein
MSAIPQIWDDGSIWEDGRLWVEPFGSNQFVLVVEQVPQRVAVEVSYSGGEDFYIDSLSLVTRLAPQNEQQYQAYFDASVGERVSLEIAYASGHDFRIDNLRVIGSVLHKRNSG